MHCSSAHNKNTDFDFLISEVLDQSAFLAAIKNLILWYAEWVVKTTFSVGAAVGRWQSA
jgi:hypothetical protein